MADDAKTLAVKVAVLENQNDFLAKIAIAATARAVALEHAAPSNLALVENIVRASGRPSNSDDGISFHDGARLVSRDAFIEGLKRAQPALFKSDGPADVASPERKRAPAHEGPNPYRKTTWNLTDQFRLEKVKPDVAAALKRAAETEQWSK